MIEFGFESLKDFSHWSQEYEEFCALLYASKDHLFWKIICHINCMEFWVDGIWLDAFLDRSQFCNIYFPHDLQNISMCCCLWFSNSIPCWKDFSHLSHE